VLVVDAHQAHRPDRLVTPVAHVRAWTILHKLVMRALASDDYDTREVGEDFNASHGACWTTHS
jgi:hypothetical protein